MSQQQFESKARCSTCGELFHEPEMGAIAGYDYGRQTVSDAHRAMFHSANRVDRNYDKEFLPAMRRLEEARARRNEAFIHAFRNNEPFEDETPGPQIYTFRAYTDPEAKEVDRRAD